MNAGHGRTPDEIAAEIRETRSRIDRTVEALEQRLSPGQLLDTAIDIVLGGKGGAGVNGRDAILAMRDNPMATALIGVGLGLVGVGLAALFASPAPGRGRAVPPEDAYDFDEMEAEYDDRRRHHIEDDVYVGSVER